MLTWIIVASLSLVLTEKENHKIYLTCVSENEQHYSKTLLSTTSMKTKEGNLLRVTNWSWPVYLWRVTLYFNKTREPMGEACSLLCWSCYLLLFSWPSANIWSSSSTVLFFLSLRAFSTVSFAHGSGALADGEDSVELIICSGLQ